MNISLRLKLDRDRNAFVAELEPGGKVAVSIPLHPLKPGLEPVTVDLDADGYVVSFSCPGMKEILEEIALEVAHNAAREAARVKALEEAKKNPPATAKKA